MTKTDYRTVSIPTELYGDIESVAEKLRFSSVAEFVKDAIRRRLEEINKNGQNHKLDDAGLIFEKQHQLTECGNCGAEFSELNIRCPTCGACLFC